MTESEDSLERVRHDFWKGKAQQAESHNRALNVKIYAAAKAAREPGVNPLRIGSLLGSPVEDLIREIKAEGWEEGYAQGAEDERAAAAVDIPEYRNPSRRNPHRIVRTKGQ